MKNLLSLKPYFKALGFAALSWGFLQISVAKAEDLQRGPLSKSDFAVNCTSREGRMSFEVDYSSYTIKFTNIEFFGQANILKNKAMGAEFPRAKTGFKIHFTYSWYYDANYDIEFDQSVDKLVKKGNVSTALVSGDDDDGASFNEVRFTCKTI